MVFAGCKVTINNVAGRAQLGKAGAIERVLVGLREERFKHGAVVGIPRCQAKRSWYGNGTDRNAVHGTFHVFKCGKMTHAACRPCAGAEAFVGGRKCLHEPNLRKLKSGLQGGRDQAAHLRRMGVVAGRGRHEERRAPRMGYQQRGSD